jgi:GNAT superfamily N-acetyltransferase
VNREGVRGVSTLNTAALWSFAALERKLLGSHPLFVSDIDSDVVTRLSGRSAFFREVEPKLFVASSGSQDVARCVALINLKYQRAKNETVGFIGHFAAAPDRGAEVRAMLEQAEAWLKQRGATRVIAPFNGAAVLGAGVLTAAFDEQPMFPFTWQPPYYADYLVDCGYAPTYPFWWYTIDFRSDKYRELLRRAADNNAVVVRPVSKKQWNRDLTTFGNLLNECFRDEWEFHPYSSEELHEFLDPLKPVLDTRQVLIAEVKGEPAGFCLGFPDWTPLFRSFRGKIGPLQILRLMYSAGRYSRAGLLGIGVLPSQRGNGVAHALAAALYRRYEERGLKEAFYYPVNEVNLRSRRFAESIGGKGRVLYHCYDKRLA